MSGFSKKCPVPEDKTKAVVPAKTKPTKKSGGGGGNGKSMKNNILDDGSMYNDPSAMDERDPNYDSEEETGREYIPSSTGVPTYDPDLRSSVKTASMKLPEYKKEVEKFMEEYFSSSDAAEWKRCVSELNCPEYSYELVKRAVSMSLDRSDRERCCRALLCFALL